MKMDENKKPSQCEGYVVESKGVKSNNFQADLIYTNLSAEYDC